MLNAKQRAILGLGALVVAVMLLFPPFFNNMSVQLAFVFHPPAYDDTVDFHWTAAVETLILQLCAVGCYTLAAALNYRLPAKPFSRLALTAGSFAGLALGLASAAFSITSGGRAWTMFPFLLCVIPIQYPGGYHLFWLRLAAMSFVTLALVIATMPRISSVVKASGVMAAAGAALGYIVVAIARAAMR